MKIARLLVGVGFLAFSAACSPEAESHESADAEAASQESREGTMLSVEDLAGAEWVAETISGEPVAENTRVTVLFGADGAVSGRGGCNSFTGSYEVDGEGLSFGPLASTMMACVDPVMEQEQRFHQMLSSAHLVRRDGEQLVIQAEAGGPETRFRRAIMASISGTIVYRERIALPPEAEVIVRLDDVSKMDVKAVTLGKTTFKTDGKQVPLSFEIEYDAGDIDPRMSYSLNASIRVDGKLKWRNSSVVSVITRDFPSDGVEILVQQVGG